MAQRWHTFRGRQVTQNDAKAGTGGPYKTSHGETGRVNLIFRPDVGTMREEA